MKELADALLGLPRPLLIALDVDGTLAPIMPNPETAAIPDGTLATLQSLAGSPSTRLALITGRDLDSLGRMERIEGIWRGVEHGGLVIAPGEQPRARALAPQQEEALARFRAWTRAHARDAFVEYKPRAVAVHVRRIASEDPKRAKALLEETEARAGALGLHVRKGRCVREAEAFKHDKSEALREIFERSGAASTFFAGDDVTDVAAIAFASAHGIGAFVLSEERPKPPSEARASVESPARLGELLSEVARRLP